jgi:hypothetical protein
VEAADGREVMCISQLMIDVSSSNRGVHIVIFVRSQVQAHMCEEKPVTERRSRSPRLEVARKRCSLEQIGEGLGGGVTRMHPKSLMFGANGFITKESLSVPLDSNLKNMHISIARCSINHRLNK